MSDFAKTSITLALFALLGCAPNASDSTPDGTSGPSTVGGGGGTGFPGGGGFPEGGVSGGGAAPSGSGGLSPGSGGQGPGYGSGGSDLGGAGSGGDGSGGDGTAGARSYVNLAPPELSPLDPNGGTTLSPPPPAGWTYFPIDGAQCRDGSSFGIYVRFGTAPKLMMYLEGGGACTDAGFCNYNPPNANMAIVGTGETVLGSAGGLVASRQQPGVYTGGVLQGIFDDANEKNPYQGWSQVYVPYCTGDVHFGSNPSATVPGVPTPQHFVGYSNMQKIVGHVVPTFQGKVDRVILTGASAGSFGAALNVSMVQDAFGATPVDVVLDSGLPFTDKYMFTCMQKTWRELWGLNDSLPSDCSECFSEDGGGLVHLADFEMKKHPNVKLAAVSSSQDEVIRLFFSMGLKSCATIGTSDPVAITIGQLDPTVYYPAADYTAALTEMKSLYGPTHRLATYLVGGPNITFHEHTFRSRFYDPLSGGKSIADFVSGFLSGTVEDVTP
ncbi:MAG TPA: pectin acetylesterase-family hydrolase [Polyangiaceae bacterium]|nr:pectin acetylesterase-family hydrolase [Polyangiaceae bacterium]